MKCSKKLLALPILLLWGCSSAESEPETTPAPAPQNTAANATGAQPKPVTTTPATKPPEPKVEEPEPVEIKKERLKPTDEQLAAEGIHRYDSEYLTLYTDVPREKITLIPGLVDLLYPEWVAYFSKSSSELPTEEGIAPGEEVPPPDNKPNAQKTMPVEEAPFHIQGYLMADREKFDRLGLIPEDLPEFLTGRHSGKEFWVLDQEWDYYRRHLVLHEATHCFMTSLPDSEGPAWYMEGMAEHFATHRLRAEGGAEFRVMPDNPEDFDGWGRIKLLQASGEAGVFQSIDQIRQYQQNEFLINDRYAWSWGLCALMDMHPLYRERFQQLGAVENRKDFYEKFNKLFIEDAFYLVTEWELFADHADYGYDIEAAAIDFPIVEKTPDGQPIQRPVTTQQPLSTTVAANRGWQPAGLEVAAGQSLRFAADGQFELSDVPKPWISEANGITFRYFDERPLGELHAAVLLPPDTDLQAVDRPRGNGLLEVYPVGNGEFFIAPHGGTLYFRLNDAWNELGDNSGQVTVTEAEEAGTEVLQ
ncbi:hypothetical protein [Calycomorphotria hydatis]|uniref:DUF1570 domain-containing protein n=1 Tax=Calycomorphotria hydatis TaxID=2528027 RepID=A0A517T587_9PLAN|nr:hypothetical protein [Calycomorphotria hydatis]QDT63539.1 hypothetical protein V22_07610 [Calycomorphotria hydatis]